MFTFAGLALPLVAFITCPTRNPMAFSLSIPDVLNGPRVRGNDPLRSQPRTALVRHLREPFFFDNDGGFLTRFDPPSRATSLAIFPLIAPDFYEAERLD